MDQLPAFGRDILPVIPPTNKVYGALLSGAPAQAIKTTPRTTHAYGTHARLQLDFYAANEAVSHAGPRPIFIFFYGGGFVTGDKVLADMQDGLAYTSLGYFFSQKLGYDTVIPDYRLVGERDKAVYPDGGSDLGAVLAWLQNRSQGSSETRPVFIMGNSAGGAHLATWLFDPTFAAERRLLIAGSKGIRVAGAVFLGAPMLLGGAGDFLAIIKSYFGENFDARAPMSLLKQAIAAGNTAANIPPILVLVSELDPEWLIDGNKQFEQLCLDAGMPAAFREIKGHNHISPPFALGTGIDAEEQWGVELSKWIAKHS